MITLGTISDHLARRDVHFSRSEHAIVVPVRLPAGLRMLLIEMKEEDVLITWPGLNVVPEGRWGEAARLVQHQTVSGHVGHGS